MAKLFKKGRRSGCNLSSQAGKNQGEAGSNKKVIVRNEH